MKSKRLMNLPFSSPEKFLDRDLFDGCFSCRETAINIIKLKKSTFLSKFSDFFNQVVTTTRINKTRLSLQKDMKVMFIYNWFKR